MLITLFIPHMLDLFTHLSVKILSSDDSGPSRYSRREPDPLLDSRDSRTGTSRDGRGGGRSRSVSPNRGYERRRPPARSTKEVSKRGEGDGKPETDDIREGGSGGSRGSSPRRAREKAPATKTSRSSSQDEAAERPDQSPDTSMPEEGQEAKAGPADTYSDWSDDDDDDILTRGEQAAVSILQVALRERDTKGV
ncbi:uncharacterized protein LOC119435090 isoform X3 [Dermacentor silvarum]|uniref:uncharacterized protein LOC119435090 isoform X3 n=1 Tax=Dermacentor silvarum TaxID=543639 RepID=UPI002101908A|nr:uncharacterized protein LOC119435090 isoform X3 [Dermacentor silvarum]